MRPSYTGLTIDPERSVILMTWSMPLLRPRRRRHPFLSGATVSLALVVVTLLAACGGHEDGPSVGEKDPAVVGELGCSEPVWMERPSFPAAVQGSPTAEEAIRSALDPWMDRYGGEVVLFVEDRGSLVVEQNELVVVTVFEAPAGGWLVATLVSCEPFD